MKITRSLLALLLLTTTIYGQQDFNNYKNLRAEGEIPDDFTTNAFRKIDDDLEAGKLKLKKEKIFLEGVHYAINDLLHSGMVVYGDEVSQYVNSVADKLLAKEEVLQKKLRFYTIKTNETNAFSTYQGIIFVTTGLISQLTNEAELAYVLSHEIAHYTEEHVVETFDYKIKNRRNQEKIQSLSKFSKENEFEADKLGIKLYHQAGYSKDQLLSTFDVLLYSYLPFEDIEFTRADIDNELLTIPSGYYPQNRFEIKATEDGDDSKSSHPNVKKRKEAVVKELENYKEWGSQVYLLGKEKFEYIRLICRFESVRTDIVDAEFDDALYSIFILEKQFPKSLYLKRMKAKAWLGYAQYKSTGDFSKKIPSVSDMEGEIGTLQYVLKQMSKKQALAVSMRMIEDVRKEFPEDKMINGIWEKMIKTMAGQEKMELEKFVSKTYAVAYQEFNASKKDTVKTVENTENLSKYDKIKKQNSGVSEVTLFDTTSFYLYALSDLVQEKSFLDKYKVYKEEHDEKKAQEEEFEKLSFKEREKYYKKKEREEFSLGVTSLIYLEPLVYSYGRKGVNRIKSEKLQVSYVNSLKNVSKDLGMNVSVLGTSTMIDRGTEAFNQRALLMSYFSELIENDEIEVFSTDYNLLQELKEKTNTDKVMLSILEHENRSRINPGVAVVSALFYPTFVIYVSSAFMMRNRVNYSFLVIDLGKGEIASERSVNAHEPISKFAVEARIYEVLSNLKLNKAQ